MQCPNRLFVVLSPAKKEYDMGNIELSTIELMMIVGIIGILVLLPFRL